MKNISISHGFVYGLMAVLYLGYCLGLPGGIYAALAVPCYVALSGPVTLRSRHGLFCAGMLLASLLALGHAVMLAGAGVDPSGDPSVVYPGQIGPVADLWV